MEARRARIIKELTSNYLSPVYPVNSTGLGLRSEISLLRLMHGYIKLYRYKLILLLDNCIDPGSQFSSTDIRPVQALSLIHI